MAKQCLDRCQFCPQWFRLNFLTFAGRCAETGVEVHMHDGDEVWVAPNSGPPGFVEAFQSGNCLKFQLRAEEKK